MVKMESHLVAAGTFWTWRWPGIYGGILRFARGAGKSARDENG